jgi:acetyltransferase
MLDMFFSPRSVAVIGASRQKDSAGQGILRSLLKGGVFQSSTNVPFKGKIFAVNPNADSVLGVKCHKSVSAINGSVDLAIIAVPAKIVPIVLKDCIKKNVKGAIVISAGFSELGEQGKLLEKEIKSITKGKIRLIGPNCLGLIRPGVINASFGPCMPKKGNIAFFSQSGALIDSVIDWSLETNYGFSAVVSLGNKADIRFIDLLRWAEADSDTKAIALYLEGLKDGRAFMRAASKVSMKKPIIALKAGRSKTGMKAVSSHTGSLAGSYEIYKAAFRQSGIHVADDVEDLFEMSDVLANMPSCDNGIAIITNGGGAGVLCADHCEKLGVNLTRLTDKTVSVLDKSGMMHPAYSRSNPLDLVGDAKHERYEVAIDTLLRQKDIHGLIVIQTLQTMTQSMLDADALINARKRYPNKPIIASYMGGKFSKKAVEHLQNNSVPQFNVPYRAARAMHTLIQRKRYICS